MPLVWLAALLSALGGYGEEEEGALTLVVSLQNCEKGGLLLMPRTLSGIPHL